MSSDFFRPRDIAYLAAAIIIIINPHPVITGLTAMFFLWKLMDFIHYYETKYTRKEEDSDPTK